MIETDRPAHVALRRRGLARRIYAAFLLAAVIPTAVAGVIGVFYSLNALRTETLRNLTQEVGIRAQGVGRFFDQLSSEMLYLADNQTVSDLAEAVRRGGLDKVDVATKRLERDFSALASVYPHIYQIRFLDSRGREVVRVDRRNTDTYIVPKGELQDKSDRYYVRDALKLPCRILF
jgi:hypothetical protein